ncbi:hypothetical protein LCGC14_0365790 [marine sediment metagenome]|uniref:Uncharacterized protein n=1 Tax=marine sediment metagenome TaxID=412755 RepID=A0A0F9TPP1_9ZZZZ
MEHATDSTIFKEYKGRINDTRRRGGQYWTNLVASLLRQADAEIGKDETNKLIRECNLSKYGWQEENQPYSQF